MNNKQLLKEDTGTHEYGCLMLYFEFPGVSSFHTTIDPNDIYEKDGDRSYGLETEPHVTLLYGFHDNVDIEEIMNIGKKHDFNHCKLHNVSLFQNSEFDVLKFDVEGQTLHQCNEELQKFPHTNEYTTYHPHMTIAYLKPGTGEKYIKKFDWLKFYLTPNKLVYSSQNGKVVIEEI